MSFINGTDFISNFCEGLGTLWDLDVLWNTERPDITACMRETLIPWLPIVWLGVLAPFYVHYTTTNDVRRYRVHSNWLNITRMTLSLLLCLVWLMAFVSALTDRLSNKVVPMPYIVTPAMISASMLVSAIIYQCERRAAFITSGVHSIFWTLHFMCGVIVLQSNIRQESREEVRLYSTFLIHCVLVFVQFCLIFTTEKSRQAQHANICPEATASFFSRATFWWINGLILKGYKKDLVEGDLWNLNPRDLTRNNYKNFSEEWEKALKREIKKTRSRHNSDTSLESDTSPLLSHPVNYGTSESLISVAPEKKSSPSVSLWKVLLKVGRGTLLQAHLCKLVCDGLVFVGPLLQKQLIRYVSTTDNSYLWKGYVYAVMFFVTAILNSFFFHQLYHIGMTLGMRLKAVIIAAVYKKALTMNSDSYRSSTVGEIVNLMSVDAQRIQDITGYLWMIWSAPLQIGIAIYMLWNILGPSILAGLGVMILMLPINAVTATIQRKLQMRQMKLKDERIKLMNEILNGIKVLKLYAWEDAFREKIEAIREQELITLKKYAYLGAVTNFLWTTAPFLIMLATFLTFILTGGKLDAEKAFVSLSLFNILQFPITILPMLITFLIMASVSLKRLGKFLQNEDLDSDNVQHDESNVNAIDISNGNFAWGLGEDDSTILKNINLKVRKGELKAVVGRVGEGKSSLVSAILGEMYKLTGKVNVQGSIAYVAQQAWIQNSTVRDNILFTAPYDEKRYNQVIQACQLKPDLDILPAGDQTEIGEKGINLSGGQKQRVSLARAVYADADVYIFDDPLSALDAHVGKKIFDDVISDTGILKGKTRILVTHGVQWLPRVDSIVVLVDGNITEQGTYDELMTQNAAFARFLKQYLAENVESEDEFSDPEISKTRADILRRLDSMPDNTDDVLSSSAGSLHTPIVRQRSKKPLIKAKSKKNVKAEEEKEKKSGTLIEKEKEEVGNVSLRVFTYYLKACGFYLMSASISLYLVYSAMNMYTSIWLSTWTQDPLLNNATIDPHGAPFQHRQMMYLGVYSGLGILQTFLVLVYCLGIALSSVNASRIMHSGMLYNILRAPMSFFETTPTGRILNRFSRDIETIDNTLISLFRNWINTTSIVITTVIVISYSTPIFIAMILPMALLYYFIQRFYIPTSRQLKRIEATTRSPIYVNFSETVTGASTIRAFGKQNHFVRISENLVDHNLIFYFANIVSNRWIGMRLEFIGALVVFSAAMFAVIGRGTINPGLVGLSLTYALEITSNLNWMVRMTSELEANVVSVERIKEYTETEQEDEWTKEEDVLTPTDWPTSGDITFEDYEVRYREGLELVLKGITFDIKSGEKIGVVGRTGAGKSSLTLALFRIIESSGGSIKIDGYPISKLGLHYLRKNITILPQDPVLFSGTLRLNIDPTHLHTDAVLWQTLEHAQLKRFVENLPAGLDYEVGESGGNLSIGQRQLVCLARTLLRKTRILVLDEATAAVDLETDEFIQRTIREQCADCTVITIAHRLNTILDSDRVLLLDSGTIKEFDNPQKLLADKKSSFYAMAKDAGIVS